MKKVFLVFLAAFFALSLAACQKSDKNNDGGNTPSTDTPIVKGVYSTYLGNYKITKVIRKSGTGTDYDTDNNPTKVLDIQGAVVVDGASKDYISLNGKVQVGGNFFIDDTIDPITTPNPNPYEGPVEFNNHFLEDQTYFIDNSTSAKFTDVENGYTYEVSMQKISDSTATDVIDKALWANNGLCYTNNNNISYNCYGNATSDSTKLIGNYYIDNIIFNQGDTCAGVTINNKDNNLVGELASSATIDGGNVPLGLVLKFQYNSSAISPSCALSTDNSHFVYVDSNFNINSQEALNDMAKVFSAVGLNVIGTDTITYEPKTQSGDTFVPFKFNGHTVTITLKKVRNGQLFKGFAKALANTPYYTINTQVQASEY